MYERVRRLALAEPLAQPLEARLIILQGFVPPRTR